MRRAVLSLFLALLLLFSAGCAARSAPAQVSDADAAALRAQYPYASGVLYDYASIVSFDQIASAASVQAIVVLRPKGDYTHAVQELTPFENNEAVEGFPTTLQSVFLNAEVESVLWAREGVEVSDAIGLFFGSTITYNGYDLICEGGRYVCILERVSPSIAYAELPDLYTCSTFLTLRVTEGDVLVSLTADPALDAYTGWYLDAFAEDARKQMKKAE